MRRRRSCSPRKLTTLRPSSPMLDAIFKLGFPVWRKVDEFRILSAIKVINPSRFRDIKYLTWQTNNFELYPDLYGVPTRLFNNTILTASSFYRPKLKPLKACYGIFRLATSKRNYHLVPSHSLANEGTNSRRRTTWWPVWEILHILAVGGPPYLWTLGRNSI